MTVSNLTINGVEEKCLLDSVGRRLKNELSAVLMDCGYGKAMITALAKQQCSQTT